MPELINTVYDTSASIGRTFSYIKFTSVIIIACIVSIIGSSIIIKNKDTSDKNKNKNMYIGSGFLVFGSFITIIASIFTYLTTSFKPFAALQGASDVVTLTKNVF
jgi:hypothetical protein